ncbi:cytochrome P450 20A1-like [Saccostrea echinata]|uniref:cytochrome P450 20A1-like n=1 Tax=Saccostrea echinata TaxID=191078 RepID=UPI002A80AB74|nr:cytochrome P450 20A1-like [Saccostrea echinata]
MLDFVIFAATFLTALLIATIYFYPGSRRVTRIPGPEPTTKEDGNLSDIARAGSLHQYLMMLHKQYGDITAFWMGQELVVSICSPELFKQHASVFDRPPSLFELFKPLLGEKSPQYANKADGRKRRKCYDSVLAHDYLHHYYPAIQEISDNLVKKWSTIAKDEHIPLAQYMNGFSLKVVLVSLFGNKAWSDEQILEFIHQHDIVWGEMERRLTDFPEEGSSRIKAFEEAKNRMLELFKKIIKNPKKLKDADEYLFIDALLDSTTDKDQIFSDVITYVIGGYHTTGNLLTWAVYFLATYQDIQDKVYKEIRKVLGKEDVNPKSAKDLVYLNQVIDETLRCAIVAPWAARYQDIDSELGGHKIPKNTPVIHALGVSLQNGKYYPVPNKFDPDRFSPENKKSRPTLAFQPFGFAGKRMCPAYKFAYAEAIIGLATLLRKFKIRMVEGQVVTPVYGYVTHPKDEIWVEIEKR